ncbi:MAG: outer membrane protein assembly factor BamA [Burkholderiaceae bacterium]
MRKVLIGLAVLGMTLSGQIAWAVSAFVIKDIRIEGLQRTEAGTVFSYLPVKVGDTFSDDKAATSIKALFATGFFKDVKIEVDGEVLVVYVQERPAIYSLDIVGTKEFDKDTLKKALKDIGVGESKIFDRAMLDRAEQELKRQYLSRGKYAAEVTTTVSPLDRNRVAVVFTVSEGETAAIKKISVVGNKAFAEKDLLREFTLQPSNVFSFYTKNDQYSRQKLSGDLESLRSFYLNRGYLEFNVESTQVQIAPNKQDIYIAINVNEGDKFTVGSIKIAGDLMNREKELRSLVTLKSGETFNGQLLSESTKAITDRLGNYGYAFSNANAAPEINRTTKVVDFTIYIDPGKRVYVRRINVGGNTRTRDEVIRRELRQFESSWYDAEKIKLSRERVDRLGYFKDVNVETTPVAGTSDQIDVNVTVAEKPTGNLLLGAGVSSTDKLILSGSVQQQNVFGSGQTVGIDVNTSRLNRTIAFSQVDPYFTLDGISRSYDIYTRRTDPSVLNLGNYRIVSNGAGIRFGVPVSELDRVSFGLAYEGTKLSVNDSSPSRFRSYVNDFGPSSYGIVSTLGYQRDSRNSAIAPTTGTFRRFNGEWALPTGDQRFTRFTYQEQHFFPIKRDYALALNGEITIGSGYGGRPFPIFRNVYAGGIGTVRGYQTSSLGPRDNDGLPIGGARRLIGNAEFYFPIPGLNSDRSFRAFTFLDAGNVYDVSQRIDLGELRYSTGFGVSWLSPVGPLKFSIGAPLNANEQDRKQAFQFTIGTGF